MQAFRLGNSGQAGWLTQIREAGRVTQIRQAGWVTRGRQAGWLIQGWQAGWQPGPLGAGRLARSGLAVLPARGRQS